MKITYPTLAEAKALGLPTKPGAFVGRMPWIKSPPPLAPPGPPRRDADADGGGGKAGARMPSPRMTRADRNALITGQRCAQAITAVVNETPAGAEGPVLYTALMAYISVDHFEAMMRGLVAAERISRRGNRYFPAIGR
jgi:hypothetical protein